MRMHIRTCGYIAFLIQNRHDVRKKYLYLCNVKQARDIHTTAPNKKKKAHQTTGGHTSIRISNLLAKLKLTSPRADSQVRVHAVPQVEVPHSDSFRCLCLCCFLSLTVAAAAEAAENRADSDEALGVGLLSGFDELLL